MISRLLLGDRQHTMTSFFAYFVENNQCTSFVIFSVKVCRWCFQVGSVLGGFCHISLHCYCCVCEVSDMKLLNGELYLPCFCLGNVFVVSGLSHFCACEKKKMWNFFMWLICLTFWHDYALARPMIFVSTRNTCVCSK